MSGRPGAPFDLDKWTSRRNINCPNVADPFPSWGLLGFLVLAVPTFFIFSFRLLQHPYIVFSLLFIDFAFKRLVTDLTLPAFQDTLTYVPTYFTLRGDGRIKGVVPPGPSKKSGYLSYFRIPDVWCNVGVKPCILLKF